MSIASCPRPIYKDKLMLIHCTVLCLVAQSCPTLCNPMDCSLPGSSVHGDPQEYWSGLPCLLTGDPLNPGIELRFPIYIDKLIFIH